MNTMSYCPIPLGTKRFPGKRDNAEAELSLRVFTRCARDAQPISCLYEDCTIKLPIPSKWTLCEICSITIVSINSPHNIARGHATAHNPSQRDKRLLSVVNSRTRHLRG
jgi:hypothetical protein